MSRLSRDRRFVRFTLLLVLVLSIMGPWTFDRIHVPAEYNCQAPFIRLDGDFCGSPMSWLFIFSWFTDGFFLSQPISEFFASRGRELLAALVVMVPILPLFSSLLLLITEYRRRLRVFHLIIWGLGCLFPLAILFFEWSSPVFRLWGAWLYILLALAALLYESLGGGDPYRSANRSH